MAKSGVLWFLLWLPFLLPRGFSASVPGPICAVAMSRLRTTQAIPIRSLLRMPWRRCARREDVQRTWRTHRSGAAFMGMELCDPGSGGAQHRRSLPRWGSIRDGCMIFPSGTFPNTTPSRSSRARFSGCGYTPPPLGNHQRSVAPPLRQFEQKSRATAQRLSVSRTASGFHAADDASPGSVLAIARWHRVWRLWNRASCRR